MGGPQTGYKLQYHPDVKKIDLLRIDTKNKKMIQRAIEERLAISPEIYGKPLQRNLKSHWKLRIGNYRIIFKIQEDRILILGIINRKTVYSQINKRIDPTLNA